MRNAGQGRGQREAGQSVVEFAIAVTVFLLVAFALMQFALLFHARLQVVHAAREGARYAAIKGTEDTATQEQIAEYVIKQAPTLRMPPLQPSDITVTPANPPRPSGSNVTVSVRYNAQALVPLIAPLLGGSVIMRETVTRRVE